MFRTDLVSASMVKYCINSFLATKVTFMNEMYDVLKAAKGADWWKGRFPQSSTTSVGTQGEGERGARPRPYPKIGAGRGRASTGRGPGR